MGTPSEQAPGASRSVELAGAVELEPKWQERHLELVPAPDLLPIVRAAEVTNVPQSTLHRWLHDELIHEHGRGPHSSRLVSVKEIRSVIRPREATKIASLPRLTELRAQGKTDEEIAEELGVSETTAYWWRSELGLPPYAPNCRPAKVRQRDERDAAIVAAVDAGTPVERAARTAGTSSATGYRALHAAERELSRRKYPEPGPRECSLSGCDVVFAPSGTEVAYGRGQYCSKVCAYAARAGRFCDARAELERRKAAEDLLETADVAELFGVEPVEVTTRYRELGLKPIEQLRVDHLPHTYLYERKPVEAFLRAWALGLDTDARRALWLDEDHVLKIWNAMGRLERLADARGLTADEVEAILRDRTRRKAKRLRNRRRGRRQSSGPPPHHAEWAERFEEMKRELVERWDAYHVDGDPRPTRWEVARLVAYADYEQHPDRWSYRPADHPRQAADRIWAAVKPLQNAPSEIPAP
jgi:transposase